MTTAKSFKMPTNVVLSTGDFAKLTQDRKGEVILSAQDAKVLYVGGLKSFLIKEEGSNRYFEAQGSNDSVIGVEFRMNVLALGEPTIEPFARETFSVRPAFVPGIPSVNGRLALS